jgi:hypothetical protein
VVVAGRVGAYLQEEAGSITKKAVLATIPFVAVSIRERMIMIVLLLAVSVLEVYRGFGIVCATT